MTRSTAEVQGQKLQQQEADFNNYAAQKQQEIAEELGIGRRSVGNVLEGAIKKIKKVF